MPIKYLNRNNTGQANPAGPGSWTTGFNYALNNYAISYGNGYFVATGDGFIARSSNANTWEYKINTSSGVRGVAYGNGLWVAVTGGTGNTGVLYTSSNDGVSWTNLYQPANNYRRGVAYGNSVWVIICDSRSSDKRIFTSTDGSTWTARDSGVIYNSFGITNTISFGGGTFVLVCSSGSSGNTTLCFTSSDGINWTERTLPASTSWKSSAYGNGVWVAVGSGHAARSTDNGATWSSISGRSGTGVTYGDGYFVIAGDSPAYSTDGINWTTISSGPPANSNLTNHIAYGNGIFASVKDTSSSNISTSPMSYIYSQVSPIKFINRNNSGTATPTGNSVQFNGSNQYLSVGTGQGINNFGTGNFTIEAWVYFTVVQNGQFISAGDGNNTNAYYWQYYAGQLEFGKQGIGSITVYGWTPSTNTWYHVAVARSETTVTQYINGASVSSGTSNVSFVDGPTYIAFGGAGYFNGRISNARILKGTALYTASFTAPTSPLTAITNTSLLTCNAATIVDASSSISTSTGAFPIYNTTDSGLLKTGGTRTDTNSSSLVLAIPMDGANNGTTFTDESANIKGSGTAKTITNNGSIPTLTAISKFYGSSAYFSNASAQSIVFGNYGTDFQFTGDFTIECWVYPTTSGATDGSLFVLQSGGSNYFAFNFDPGTTFNIYNNSGGPSWSPSVSSVTTGQWNHFALIRSGNTQQVFVNGISIGTNTASGTLGYSSTSADFARIGGGASGAINSFIQDLRVYKGVAKYTANFTPPRNPNTITNNNTATVSSITPFTVVTATTAMKMRKVYSDPIVLSGTQKAIFGYGNAGATVSMTNLVSNTGVVATDTTGVGTVRRELAAAGYGSDKAIFGYGDNGPALSMTNLVSNNGVVSTDTTGVGTARAYLAAAGYGTDKALFGYGYTGAATAITNLVSNTGAVSTDTTGVGTARWALAAAGYGSDKAIFGYGHTGGNPGVSMTNLVSNTGVVATDTTGVGSARYVVAAAGYGADKAIFGYGHNGGNLSMTNLVSNAGVVATDTTGVGTSRYGLAAAGYGTDKAIFGYGYTNNVVSMTNLVSNTGVVVTDTVGVGTVRYMLAAAGYSLT